LYFCLLNFFLPLRWNGILPDFPLSSAGKSGLCLFRSVDALVFGIGSLEAFVFSSLDLYPPPPLTTFPSSPNSPLYNIELHLPITLTLLFLSPVDLDPFYGVFTSTHLFYENSEFPPFEFFSPPKGSPRTHFYTSPHSANPLPLTLSGAHPPDNCQRPLKCRVPVFKFLFTPG